MLLSALIVFGSIAAALAATTADSARDSVVCAEVSFSRAAERRDLGSFTRLIDAEARFVTGSVLRGPQAVASAWARYFEPGGPEIRWRPAIVEVVGEGTLALSRGPYRIRGQDAEGNPTEAWGTFNSVWRLQHGGEWKVLFDAGGDHGKTPTAEERQVLEAEPDCG